MCGWLDLAAAEITVDSALQTERVPDDDSDSAENQSRYTGELSVQAGKNSDFKLSYS